MNCIKIMNNYQNKIQKIASSSFHCTIHNILFTNTLSSEHGICLFKVTNALKYK